MGVVWFTSPSNTLKDCSDFCNFVPKKGTKGVCKGSCDRTVCAKLDLLLKICFVVADQFGVIRFCLRHKSITCVALGREPTSVYLQLGSPLHMLKLSPSPFCIQSLTCDPWICWLQGASCYNDAWQSTRSDRSMF